MYKKIIQKQTTPRGNVVLTFNGDDHVEDMLFRSEEEFQLFIDYLDALVLLDATIIERKGEVRHYCQKQVVRRA